MAKFSSSSLRRKAPPRGRARSAVWAGVFAAALISLGLPLGPLAATEYAAGRTAVAEDACRGEVYEGFISGAQVRHCQTPLFAFPSSAAFRCGLYEEAGAYPSGLMRKACSLYDSGVIKTFVQDVVGESATQD